MSARIGVVAAPHHHAADEKVPFGSAQLCAHAGEHRLGFGYAILVYI